MQEQKNKGNKRGGLMGNAGSKYKTTPLQMSSSADVIEEYIEMRFGDEASINSIHKNFLIKQASTYRVF